MTLRSLLISALIATAPVVSAPPVQAQTMETLLTRNSETDRYMVGTWIWQMDMFGERWTVTGIYKPQGYLEIRADRPPFGNPIIQYGVWSTEQVEGNRFYLTHTILGNPIRMRARRDGPDSFEVVDGFVARRDVW